MEGKRQVGSSSSSFTADLFGIKEPQPTSSTGIFASIFPPPSSVYIDVAGKSTPSSEMIGWQKQPSGSQPWNSKQAPHTGGASYNTPNREKSYTYREERVEPCHLSSSLYYGGQDIYSQSASTQTSESYPLKEEGDSANGNNSQGASRGNWWQGSLYY